MLGRSSGMDPPGICISWSLQYSRRINISVSDGDIQVLTLVGMSPGAAQRRPGRYISRYGLWWISLVSVEHRW